MDIDPSRLHSIRTSFKLSKEADQAIESLAEQYHITQKELTLTLMIKYPDITVNQMNQNTIHDERQIKTKVLSKQVLDFLEQRAQELNTSRDQVFEALISQAQNNAEVEKQRIKDALGFVDDLISRVGKVENIIKEQLGSEHPVVNRIGLVNIVLDNLASCMENHITYNSPIDSNDISDTGYVKKMEVSNSSESSIKSDKQNEFLKIYKSNVPNSKISLEKQIYLSRLKPILSTLPETGIIESYSSLHFWDFGVRASEKLKKGDIVWILTGDTLYKGEILTIIKDKNGRLGDAIGWSRQFKGPWKNVAALCHVSKIESIPSILRPYLRGEKASIDSNFYQIV